MKILLASHPKYIKAKFNFRVLDFYTEIGQMLSYSGLMVENLLKNLGREYRDILKQVELEEALGNTSHPRLRGSETVFTLFGEFTRLYCLLPERRPPTLNLSQNNDLPAQAELTDLEFKQETATAGNVHTAEIATGSCSSQPYPVRVHRQDYQDQQPLQNDFAITNSMRLNQATTPDADADADVEATRTRRKANSSKSNTGNRLKGRQRFRIAPWRFNQTQRGPSARATLSSLGHERKRRKPEEEKNGPPPKKTCPCEEKASKFQEEILHVLSGIGQELQLLRQGFFALYDIKENQSAEDNTAEEEYDDEDGHDNINDHRVNHRDDEDGNAIPNVVFPNLVDWSKQ